MSSRSSKPGGGGFLVLEERMGGMVGVGGFGTSIEGAGSRHGSQVVRRCCGVVEVTCAMSNGCGEVLRSRGRVGFGSGTTCRIWNV